ncbi:MAG: pantoate--beta-alanine ligase [Pseudomonadales bacterium]|nr:4-phosphopantoate--beta-alanine ligase [Pseudomonadales bacterium]
MELIRSIEACRSTLEWRRNKRTVGLLTTMGNLHEGHLALVKACRERADISVVASYVNPLLFDSDDAFLAHPRALAADVQHLENLKVDVLFAPADEEMFPTGTLDCLQITSVSPSSSVVQQTFGRDFEARATVWLKLLNIVRPEILICGEKNYAHMVGLQRVLTEFTLDTRLIGVPIARDADGVALGGELTSLTLEQRRQAPILQQTLQDVAVALTTGARNFHKLEHTARLALRGGGFGNVEVTVRDAQSLALPEDRTHNFRILGTASLGGVRLIDNVGVDL